jgi:hypothetical protein
MHKKARTYFPFHRQMYIHLLVLTYILAVLLRLSLTNLPNIEFSHSRQNARKGACSILGSHRGKENSVMFWDVTLLCNTLISI